MGGSSYKNDSVTMLVNGGNVKMLRAYDDAVISDPKNYSQSSYGGIYQLAGVPELAVYAK